MARGFKDLKEQSTNSTAFSVGIRHEEYCTAVRNSPENPEKADINYLTTKHAIETMRRPLYHTRKEEK